MRKKLGSSLGERKIFYAKFSRLGKKVNYLGYSEETVLLVDVTDDTNNIVCDHVWFNYTKTFESIGLQAGDFIQFEARVKTYKKGYVNRSLNIDRMKTDFKLSHPTKIKKMKIEIDDIKQEDTNDNH